MDQWQGAFMSFRGGCGPSSHNCFSLGKYSIYNFAGPLFAELLPGLAWKAFISSCWGVTNGCNAVCIPLTGGALGGAGLSPLSHTRSVWTAQDSTFLVAFDKGSGYVPAISQELICNIQLCASRYNIFFLVFTLCTSFSLFHLLYFFEDVRWASLHFTHWEGEGAYFWHWKQHSVYATKVSTFTCKYSMWISSGRSVQLNVNVLYPDALHCCDSLIFNSCILVSAMPPRSQQWLTPREEFTLTFMASKQTIHIWGGSHSVYLW